MSHFGRSGPPDITDTYSLLILNISFRTTADDLYPLFDKYGKVVDVFIPRDRRTGESRGFAFVRYKYQDEAQKAVDKLDGKLVDGREIMVQFAKYGPNAERIGSKVFRTGNRVRICFSKTDMVHRFGCELSGSVRVMGEGLGQLGAIQVVNHSGSKTKRQKGRIIEPAFKTRSRSRSPRPRYRDDYRDRDYRRGRSRSRSRDRYERDRYQRGERGYRDRSRSYSRSPSDRRARGRDRYDGEKRSPSPYESPRRSAPRRTRGEEEIPDRRARTPTPRSVSPRGRHADSRSQSPPKSDAESWFLEQIMMFAVCAMQSVAVFAQRCLDSSRRDSQSKEGGCCSCVLILKDAGSEFGYFEWC
ncbi:Serine/arginine-rich splicing factor SC35-like protein [Drosera capensis]